MPETASDVGFADFVAVLLVETLDSIVASHTSQAERLRSLEAAAQLTPEEFASTGIADEVLSAMLAQLFPGKDGGTSIVVGGPAPEEDALEELDVTLGGRAVRNGKLTKIGVAKVTKAALLYLATRQLEAVRETQRRGVPRVIVDGGTLRATLNFTAVNNEDDPRPRPTTPPTRPSRTDPLVARTVNANLVRFDSPIRAGVLDSIRRLRLNVTSPPVGGSNGPGGDGGPDGDGPTTTQVYGEVEIRFRTEL